MLFAVPNPDRPADSAADNYEDVTEELKGWLKQAPAGYTFLDRGFTMEDAMHGWEVLSPKMDTGVGYASTVIASEVVPQDLSPAAVAGGMDKALAVEMVFYRGYCSSHTVGTCHLLSSLALARDPVLRLFLRAVLSSIHAVLEIVRSAEISYEEEMIRVMPDFDVDQEDPEARPALLKELLAAEAQLSADAKAGNADAGALRVRLTLRRSLLELLTAAVAVGDSKPLSSLRDRIAAVSGALAKVGDQFNPGAAPSWTYDEHVVRRDPGMATPARAIPQLDGPQLAAEITTFLADFTAAGLVPDRSASLEELMSALVLYGMRRPGVVPRACLRRFVTFGDRIVGQPAAAQTTFYLALLKVPRHYLSDARTGQQKLLEAQALTLQYLFINMCMNPARQRRRLRTLLAEASQLLHAGAELDRLISTDMEKRKFHRFFTAVQVLVCSLFSVQFLRLGSALSLYETDELAAVYWGVWHFHHELGLWKEQLEAAKVKDDKKAPSGGAAAGKKKGKGGGAGGAAGAAAPASVKPRVMTYLDMVRGAEEHLARGIYLTFLAAQAKGVYSPSHYDLQPPETRWQLRFSCLPLYVNFERYCETVAADSKAAPERLVEQAVEEYRVAKQKIESAVKSRGDLALEMETSYWRSLTKVAVINTLNLQMLKPGTPPGITPDWSHNQFFPALVFGKKQK